MGVIVVKASAIGEHEIALDLLETQRPILINLVVGRLICVLEQLRCSETARIAMRIFEAVVPFHVGAVLRVRAHQLDRFGNYVH